VTAMKSQFNFILKILLITINHIVNNFDTYLGTIIDNFCASSY